VVSFSFSSFSFFAASLLGVWTFVSYDDALCAYVCSAFPFPFLLPQPPETPSFLLPPFHHPYHCRSHQLSVIVLAPFELLAF